MKKFFFLNIVISFIFYPFCYGQKNDSIVNYLNLPQKIIFENKTYTLVSSSHSSANHFKQDYAILGDTDLNLNTKIYFEVLIDTINIATVVNKKIESIKKMKDKNHIVDHSVFRKDGVIMLHFMISELLMNGPIAISSSRYVNLFKKLRDEVIGEEGIILFGFSATSKNIDLDDPDIPINEMRKFLLKDVGAFKIPEITLNR